MPRFELEIDPVDYITTDAIGQPGQRVFYIQAGHTGEKTTLLVEKVQVQSLALGVEEFLSEIFSRFPDRPIPDGLFDETSMHIIPPVDPLFRVGELGLAYETERDQVILVAREVLTEGDDPEEAGVVRFWCTRDQIHALARWGIEVANRGRPVCPQCGEPMDPSGHFCPKKNGHKH